MHHSPEYNCGFAYAQGEINEGGDAAKLWLRVWVSQSRQLNLYSDFDSGIEAALIEDTMHHSDRDIHRNGFRAAPTNKPWKRKPRWTLGRVIRWAIVAVLLATAWSVLR